MKKKALTACYLTLLFYCFIQCVNAQNTGFPSPYSLSWGRDVPLVGAGIGLNTVYLFLDHRNKGLNTTQISLFNRNDIWKLDRSASYNWSPPAAKISDVVMFTGMAAPSLLFIDPNIRRNWPELATIWAETFLLNVGITNITKVLTKRTRPYVYNAMVPLAVKQEKDSRYSFFSGHTSMAASMTFMTAKIFTDYHPRHKALPYIWATAAIIPAGAAFLRWRAGKHFATDVITGYIVGAAIGYITPHIHKL